MKPIIVDMEDMSDSVEVYESRPHPFFVIFIYFTFFMLVSATVWMYFSKIDIVVKGQGIVRTEENNAIVTNTYAGKIKQCNIKDGTSVKKGDILYEIEHDETDKQLEEYEIEYKDVNKKIEMLNVYSDWLNGKKDTIDEYKENKYFSEINSRKKLIDINCNAINTDNDAKKKQYDLNISSYDSSIEYYEDEISNLNTMINCIKNRNNNFDETDVYYYTSVQSYITNYNQIVSAYNDKITELEKNLSSVKTATSQQSNTTSKEDLQTEQSLSKDEINVQIEKYENSKKQECEQLENDNIKSIEQQLKTTNETIQSLKNSKSGVDLSLDTISKNSTENNEQQLKVTESNVIYTEIETYKSKISEIKKNINTLKENIENSVVTATKDGVVNFNIKVENGNYIASGTEVLNIITEGTDCYVMENYITNKDVAKLEECMDVKYELQAFPSSEYGNITGKVNSISKDIKINDSDGNAYYTVISTIDNFGNACNIENKLKVGMSCETKIVTGEQRILDYLLEKIDLID